VLVGIAFFDEPSALVRILLIFAIVAAIAGLRFTA
jgi:quaternary ammonium compound-resistance protein SugE